MEEPRAVAGIEWVPKKYLFTCPVSGTAIQLLGVGRQNNKAVYITGSHNSKRCLNMCGGSEAAPRSVT